MRKSSWQRIVKNSLLIFLALVLAIPTVSTLSYGTPTPQETTVVRVVPETLEFGPEDVVGEEFTVAVVVENVTDLYGLDIQFSWNTTYLEYVSHTATIPVEDYPDAVDPSPYAGLLHEPGMKIKDEVDEAGVPGAMPGTMYWLSYTSMAPAPSFEGNGTAFTMTFKVKSQPKVDVEIPLHFVATDLADSTGKPIAHTAKDGLVIFRAPPLPPPEAPVASFTFKPAVAVLNETVVFNASASYDPDGYVVLYIWDFGDNVKENTTDPVVIHSYTAVGSCNVTLTVLDNDGLLSDPAVKTITIVKEKVLGDLNGDGKINIYDIVLAARAYKSTPEDQNWNPLADLAPPYGIIDIYDFITIIYYFGKT